MICLRFCISLAMIVYLSVLQFILWAAVIYSSRPRCDVKTSTLHNCGPTRSNHNRHSHPLTSWVGESMILPLPCLGTASPTITATPSVYDDRMSGIIWRTFIEGMGRVGWTYLHCDNNVCNQYTKGIMLPYDAPLSQRWHWKPHMLLQVSHQKR